MRRAIECWKQQSRQLKTETYTLYLAYKDPRTPWHARLWVACVVAYALSPIDLIPDPIPILGHLDDVILIPLGIALAIRLIPPPVLAECRLAAREAAHRDSPANRMAAAIVLVTWLILLGVIFVTAAYALNGS